MVFFSIRFYGEFDKIFSTDGLGFQLSRHVPVWENVLHRHHGIVKGKVVVCYEGNTSLANQANGGCVMERNRAAGPLAAPLRRPG